jgi:hypothetical protein
MQTNPIARKLRENHDIMVHYVVKNINDIHHTAHFRIVKAFCGDNHIGFQAREYNSYHILEDKEHIERLPAFQLYLDKSYYGVFYPEDNPIARIQNEIIEWQAREEIRLKKLEARKKRISRLISFFERLRWSKALPKTMVD